MSIQQRRRRGSQSKKLKAKAQAALSEKKFEKIEEDMKGSTKGTDAALIHPKQTSLAVALGMDLPEEVDTQIFNSFIEECYELAEEDYAKYNDPSKRGPKVKWELDEVRDIIRKILYYMSRGRTKTELALALGTIPQYLYKLTQKNRWINMAITTGQEIGFAYWLQMGALNCFNKNFNSRMYEFQMNLRYPQFMPKPGSGTLGGPMMVNNITMTQNNDDAEKQAISVRERLKTLNDGALEALWQSLEDEEDDDIIDVMGG